MTGIFGLSGNEIGKDATTGAFAMIGGALGSVVLPGAGTIVGAGLAAGLAGGIWTGWKTHSLDEGVEAGVIDGVFGAMGGGVAGGAVKGIVTASGESLLRRAALGAGRSFVETQEANILGAGIGAGVASHYTPQAPVSPGTLPVRPAGQKNDGAQVA